MDKKTYKYIYGPVPSWRLGSSLGIDPISKKEKVCTFDCIYCQLGKTKHLTAERKVFVPVSSVIEELKSTPPLKIDYITFSGTGEPTLALNLGKMIKAVRRVRKEKVAVLTNSSLINREDVAKDLSLADLVVCKLDAPSQYIFGIINSPIKCLKIDTIIKAIKDFKTAYKGKLALQIMFVEKNRVYASEIASMARYIGPDEVQLNTPLRPCGIKPLARDKMAELERYFIGLNVLSVYRAGNKDVKPISSEDTLKRRGKV
ncbi:MAG: radical SAM protein [Candidatus Omnitrophica bacterium]|nr:radical SAM protein [Candidatus Omnitrophota bacterium]